MNMDLRERVFRIVIEAVLLAVCCAVFGHVVAWTEERFPDVWTGTVAGTWAFVFGVAAIWLHKRGMI